jgi:hypothetical protein
MLVYFLVLYEHQNCPQVSLDITPIIPIWNFQSILTEILIINSHLYENQMDESQIQGKKFNIETWVR